MPSSAAPESRPTQTLYRSVAITLLMGVIPTLFAFALIWSLAAHTWIPWGVLAIGLVFTMFAATYAAQYQGSQRALQASELRFRALIEQAVEAVALVTADGVVRYQSPAASRILGFAPEELLGQNAFEKLHPGDAQSSRALFAQIVRQPNTTGTTQFRHQHKDGSWRWVEATATNLLSDPAVAAIVVNYRDITASKEAQAQLQARMRQQAVVVDFSPSALIHTELNALLDEAVSVVARTLEIEYSCVMELSAQGQTLLMRAGVGWQPGLVGQAQVGVGNRSQAGYALGLGAPVISEDIRSETRFSIPELMTAHGVASGLVVIIQGGERPFGVLGVHARQSRRFNQDDVTFLQTMANVLGAAIARAAVEAELKARARELALLGELVRAALSAGDFVDILPAITVTLDELFGADSYRLLQWDEVSQCEIHTAASGAPLGLALYPHAGEPSPVQAALQAGGPLPIEDVFDSPWISPRLASAYAAHSLLSLPLLTGGPRLGALLIGFNEAHLFTPEEMDLGGQVAGRLALAVTQLQLLHETRHQAIELAAVSRVSRALRVAANRAEMLPIMLDQLLAVLTADGVAFAQRDPTTNDMIIEIGRGAWENARGQRLPASQEDGSLVQDIVQPILIDDVGADSRLAWMAQSGNITAAASISLVAQQKSLGTLWAGRREPFSGESMGLLAAVADIAASAIRRNELHEQTAHHAEQLAAVNASGRDLAELLDLPQTYARLSSAIFQLMPDVATVVISLYDHDHEAIEYAYGMQDGVPLDVAELAPVPLLLPGEGTLSRVIETRRPLIVGNFTETAKGAALGFLPGAAGHIVESALYVPMVTRGAVLGVLQVHSYVRQRFMENDAEILSIIANIGAVTIQNARLFQELQASNASLARRVEERTSDLSAANAQLARAARLKDEFLASMSHELRTPLNGILVLTESLQEQLQNMLSERHIRALHGIETSGRHLLALINDILDVSKIEAGKLELQMETLLVDEICEASLLFVKEVASKKRLSLTFELDDPQAQIVADSRRLKQILVNLLSNAVKFTSEGGHVFLEVTTEVEAGIIRFTVRDTGIGIAPEDLARLFLPFAQLDSSLTRQHEGTGLGLALVRRLAEMHGGGVSVESEVGQGSTFTVALPQGALPGLAASFTEPVFSIHQALVVEDSATAAEQIARYVQELGIQATLHLQGEGVMEQVLKSRPDVIFLDLLMPDRSGWDVLAQLKADPAAQAIPVIIVSVVDEPASGLQAGAAEYLVKPVSREQVRQALGRVPKPATGVQEALVLTVDVPAAAPAPLSNQATLLLADDNETNIQALGDYLQFSGYHVVIARNGREALAQARETKPDLILMDIQMPEMDGLEATRQLRAQAATAATPIIALTALAMPGDRERCLAAGANDYLSKPVSTKKLVQAIESLLSR